MNRIANLFRDVPVAGGPYRSEPTYLKALGRAVKEADWGIYGLPKPRDIHVEGQDYGKMAKVTLWGKTFWPDLAIILADGNAVAVELDLGIKKVPEAIGQALCYLVGYNAAVALVVADVPQGAAAETGLQQRVQAVGSLRLVLRPA